MKPRYMTTLGTAACATLLLFGQSLVAQDAAAVQQRVAALKANMQESQKQLRQYQWIQTTTISLKGEEKSRKVDQVYYGAGGTLTKIPEPGDPQPEATSGGRLKERIIEKKKDEMKDYMDKAVALIHQYVPPQPEQIQQAKDAGKVELRPAGQGLVQIAFPGFVQPGDLLAIDVDSAANRVSAINVNTYLDKPEDKVTMAVTYATLPDGTSHVAKTILNATAKNITVVSQNSGYRPMATAP